MPTKTRRTLSFIRIMRKIVIGLALEITVAGMGILAYLMVMLSGLSFAEKTFMGFYLEPRHALIFGAGYAVLAFMIVNSGVKTPLALIALFSVAVFSGLVRVAMPLIVLLSVILWFMALPSYGVFNPALGALVWFILVALPTFGESDVLI